MERKVLLDLTTRFLREFNRDDLDAVMSFFAEDAVYEELNGRRNRGLAAIRAAFEPQFSGAFGAMKFLDEDLFIDPSSLEVMVSWRCTLELDGEPTSWRGLDLLRFCDGKITSKTTYAKAKAPLFESSSAKPAGPESGKAPGAKRLSGAG